MNNLSLPRVSELMKPVERAKLIISLELKGIGESDPKGNLYTESQIKQVAAACPNSQVREYNFLISLKGSVHKMLMLIELNQSYIETLDGRASLFRQLLLISPTIHSCVRLVKSRIKDVPDRELDAVVGQLESLDNIALKKGKIIIANAAIEKFLKVYKERFHERAQEICNYEALIERVEKRYFEGMEIVSRDAKHPTGVIARARDAVSEAIEKHVNELKTVEEGVNLLGMDLASYKWIQMNDFFLEKCVADDKWVEDKLTEIENDLKS